MPPRRPRQDQASNPGLRRFQTCSYPQRFDEPLEVISGEMNNESYSNAILARCKGQGADERGGERPECRNGPTNIFAKHNQKATVPLETFTSSTAICERQPVLCL